jgi:iron-sulfur cluster repair protein YtfE (RIC family)
MHASDELDADASVSDWGIDCPGALQCFEQLGIEYACGGKSLRQACLDRNLDLSAVLARLRGER